MNGGEATLDEPLAIESPAGRIKCGPLRAELHVLDDGDLSRLLRLLVPDPDLNLQRPHPHAEGDGVSGRYVLVLGRARDRRQATDWREVADVPHPQFLLHHLIADRRRWGRLVWL